MSLVYFSFLFFFQTKIHLHPIHCLSFFFDDDGMAESLMRKEAESIHLTATELYKHNPIMIILINITTCFILYENRHGCFSDTIFLSDFVDEIQKTHLFLPSSFVLIVSILPLFFLCIDEDKLRWFGWLCLIMWLA